MDRTNAERQRRFIARLKAKAAAAEAQSAGVTNAKLEARIRELEAELARERKANAGKAASAGLMSTSDDERITKLQAELKKYARKIGRLETDNERIARGKGGMKPELYNRLLLALSPDHKLDYKTRSDAYRDFREHMQPFVLKPKTETVIRRPSPLPDDIREWDAKQRAGEAERKVKREGAKPKASSK
jgi:hypothetical protein